MKTTKIVGWILLALVGQFTVRLELALIFARPGDHIILTWIPWPA